MVGSKRATEAVAQALDELRAGTPVVLDPVMVAESGARLLEEDAEDALRELLLPRATVVTPNLLEARVLVRDATLDGEELARRVHALGPDVVVVTGGHRDEAADLFFDGAAFVPIPGPRHAGRRRPRLGLHALVDARRAAGTWRGAARRGEDRARGGRGGRAPGPARTRRGRRAGRCPGRGRSPADQVRFAIIATMKAEL